MKEFCSSARPFRKTRRSSYRSRGIMDRYLRFVLLFAVLPFAMQKAVEKGGCECAVFPMQTSEAIIERALQYNVTCSSEGEEKCQQLCIALVSGKRERQGTADDMREAEGARGKSTGRGVRENMQGDHLEVHRCTERRSDLLLRRECNALQGTDSDNRELNNPAYDRRVGSLPFNRISHYRYCSLRNGSKTFITPLIIDEFICGPPRRSAPLHE